MRVIALDGRRQLEDGSHKPVLAGSAAPTQFTAAAMPFVTSDGRVVQDKPRPTNPLAWLVRGLAGYPQL